MNPSRRAQAGGRVLSVFTVAALVASLVVLSAAPALAVGITVSPRSGPAGTRVTVSVAGNTKPCQVFYEGSEIVGTGGCPPGGVTTTFTIPGGTPSGPKTFRAVEGGNEASVTFFVGTPPPPAPPPPPPPAPPAPPPPPPPAPAPRPPAPPPAPRPPAPPARPPAPPAARPPAPPPPPAPAPAPPAASPTASPTASPSPTETLTPTPTASPTTAAACLQPSSVESLSVAPSSGEAGTTATIIVNWAPNAATDCPGSEAEVRVNGESATDPIPVSDQTRVEVDIPEDVEGGIPISLVSLDEDARVLASGEFTVEDADGDDEGVSSWLLVAALVGATLIAVAIQRLYSRRRARFGRR